MKDMRDTTIRANQPVRSHGRNRVGKIPATREARYSNAQTRRGVHAIPIRDDGLMLRIIDLLATSAAMREIATGQRLAQHLDYAHLRVGLGT